MVKINKVMRVKIFCILLILCSVILCVSAFLLIRNYYLSYNLLRLDPLEEARTTSLLLSPAPINGEIWLYGDSRIAQWNKDLLSSLERNIVNFGIEGQTTAQVLNRLKSNLEIRTPDWIILEAGINDFKIIGLKKELASSIIENCFKNITSIVKLCEKHNVKIIVINIFPTGKIEILRRFIWNASVDQAIKEVNEKLKSLCIENSVNYFDAFSILSDENSSVRKIYQDGFLHINTQAYEVLSEALIKEFGIKIIRN